VHNLVFFASGSGTNFQSVIDAVDAGRIKADITGLITDRDDIGVIQRAASHNIPVSVVPSSETPEFPRELLQQLSRFSPDLIVLAGYLKKIPDAVIERYRGKIINIHPSLLPKYGGKGYYGMRVHRAVIENGDSVSGCTVHYVDEKYDNGSIIKQKVVPVTPDDTPESLARKVLRVEHKLLPETIKELLTSNRPEEPRVS